MPSDIANPWYDRLKELYYREPFEPFVIRTATGKTATVTERLHIMFAPSIRTIRVVEGPGEVTTPIDSTKVVEVTVAKRKRSRTGRKQ